MYAISILGSSFILPSVSTFSITDSSNVSEYPLVNRLQILDHKYDNPREMNVTFTISNHNSLNKYPVIENGVIKYKRLFNKSEYLTHIYNFFTQLKREAHIVEIRIPSKKFQNTLITNMNWNDNGQWAEVTLNFKELYTYFIKEVKTKVDPGDPNLPNITDIVSQDFVQNVLLKNSLELDIIIIKILKKEQLIEDDFIRNLAYTGIVAGTTVAAALLVIGATALLLKAGAMILAAIAGATALGPIGWVIGGAVALLGAVVVGLFSLVRWFQRQERARLYIDKFREYVNADDKKKEEKRFSKTIKSIYDGVIRLNNVIKSYRLPSNISQELNITLNGENYRLIFKADDKKSDTWYMTLKDYNDEIVEIGDKKIKDVLVDPLLSYFGATNENPVIQIGNDKIHITYDTKYSSDILLEDENKKLIPGKTKKVNLERIQINITNQDLDQFKENIKKITLTAVRRKLK